MDPECPTSSSLMPTAALGIARWTFLACALTSQQVDVTRPSVIEVTSEETICVSNDDPESMTVLQGAKCMDMDRRPLAKLASAQYWGLSLLTPSSSPSGWKTISLGMPVDVFQLSYCIWKFNFLVGGKVRQAACRDQTRTRTQEAAHTKRQRSSGGSLGLFKGVFGDWGRGGGGGS